jgi:hypothetical protein
MDLYSCIAYDARNFQMAARFLENWWTAGLVYPEHDKEHSLRTSLFWVITQRVEVISYRRFGTTYWSYLQYLTFKNGTYNFSRNVSKKLPLHAAY